MKKADPKSDTTTALERAAESDRVAAAIDRLNRLGALPKPERVTLEDECTFILSERLNDRAPLYEEAYRPHARRLIGVIAAAERARIRRELLEWLEADRDKAGAEPHYALAADLRAALDRIAPGAGVEG